MCVSTEIEQVEEMQSEIYVHRYVGWLWQHNYSWCRMEELRSMQPDYGKEYGV